MQSAHQSWGQAGRKRQGRQMATERWYDVPGKFKTSSAAAHINWALQEFSVTRTERRLDANTTNAFIVHTVYRLL